MKVEKCSEGFTLIEIIISLAILAIIIGPILSLTLSSIKINKKSDDKLNALNIAQQKMEEAKFYSKEQMIEKFKQSSEGNYIMTTSDGDYSSTTEIVKKNESVSKDDSVKNEYDPVEAEKVDVVIKIDRGIISMNKPEGIDLSQKQSEFITNNILNIKLLQGDKGITLNGYKLSNNLESNTEIKIKIELIDFNLDVNAFTDCNDKKLKIFFVDKGNSTINFSNNANNQIEHCIISEKSYDLYEINIKVEKKNDVLQELKAYKIIKYR